MPQQETQLAREYKDILTTQCVGIRQRKRYIEDRWLRDRRIYMGQSFEQRYVGPNNNKYSIPAGRRVVEKSTVRVVKMLTPNVKWFEVSPLGDVEQTRLSNVDNFMRYLLLKKIKSRSNISQLARCMQLYGLPILKTGINIRNGNVWPCQRVVDPFCFYVFPETSPALEDAEIVFEDFMLSYESYLSFVNNGFFDTINRSDVTTPEWPYHLVERLAYQGITNPTADIESARIEAGRKLEGSMSGFLSMTELWLKREDKLYQVYICWNLRGGARIVGFFQSQYDNPTYRMAVHRGLPGEMYTPSQFDDIATLDTIQNDFFNEFADAVDWEKGMLALGGNATRHKDNLKLKGRAILDFSGEELREVMQFVQTPVTSTNTLRAFQVVHGHMQSMSGGTLPEGQPGRNMPRAGGAVNNLIDLSLADIEDCAEIIEQEILTPGLSDIYRAANFMPESQLIRIPGGEAIYNGQSSTILKKQDISGDYEFEWVGSLQFQSNSERAPRLMQFLSFAAQEGIVQQLSAMGYQFNLPELLHMIWRYGLGERGLDKVIVKTAMPQMAPTEAAGAGNVNGVTAPNIPPVNAPAVNGAVR